MTSDDKMEFFNGCELGRFLVENKFWCCKAIKYIDFVVKKLIYVINKIQ